MKSMPWIKQYPSRLHDVRLAQLNERQQLRYHQLYLLAGLCNEEGAFIQDGKILKTVEIAYILRIKDAAQLDKDMRALKNSRLLKVNGHGPYIADFKDEQINWMEKQKAERERKTKSRKSHANVTRDKGVTPVGVPLLEQEQEQEQDKSLVVVVVADALEKYRSEIGKLTDHTRKEIEHLYKKSPVNLCKAIDITIDQDKHTLAYLKGVFSNLQKGTAKPEARKPASQPRKLDATKQVRL